MLRKILILIPLLGLAACGPKTIADFGVRELRPPTSGIKVGSLYYVREKPTANLGSPARLERLCSFNLNKLGVQTENDAVADIDLFRTLSGSGELSGLEIKAAKLGLKGDLSKYYEYKLTNVKEISIDYMQATDIFEDSQSGRNCLRYVKNIKKQKWGVYQIRSVMVGDIEFGIKNNSDFSADLSVKIGKFEPVLKSALKRETKANVSGKGLVVAFSPIQR